MKKHFIWATLVITSIALLAPSSKRANGKANLDDEHEHEFRVSSETFTNGGLLPLSMVWSGCPVSGAGNQSPELSWKDAPAETKSFVVVMFDKTAAFTHWGMYNISRDTSELPANAGIQNSAFGEQVVNDFFIAGEYDGPCPPPNFTPVVHDYVITVYALDTNLELTSFPPTFPATGETLYQAMFGHILDHASIHGFYSTAP